MPEAMESHGRNPCLFIVGCARSGTTLLQRMLDVHPVIAVINETHWIARWLEKRRGVTLAGYATPDLIPKLLRHERFSQFRVGREDLEDIVGGGSAVPYSSFVSSIFDFHAKRTGKRLVGDKTPEYVRNLPALHDLWPTAKFIHVIRDGRDVCLSATNWRKEFKLARRFATWGDDPIMTAAVWWDWLVRLGREDGNTLGSDLYHEVRYESLVVDPASTCADLCTFLGIPYDEVMLRFHEGRSREDPGLDAKQAWLPVTVGLRDWRSQMAPEDVERFEAAAGDLLDELGYQRAAHQLGDEALEAAATIRRSLVQDLDRLGFRSPEGWLR